MRGGSINPPKAALVAEFLKESLPGLHVYDTEDFERDCQFYRIDDGRGNIRHRVRVSREFLDDHTDEQIVSSLNAWELPNLIMQAGLRPVLVTNAGCVILTEQDR